MRRMMQMKELMPRFLGSAIYCLVVSLFLSLCQLIFFFGGSDFIVFTVLTFLYSLIVGSMSWPLGKLPGVSNEWGKFFVALFLAIFASFAWSVVMAIFLGASIRALNFSAFFTWLAGGMAGFSYLLKEQENNRHYSIRLQAIAFLLGIPFICVGIIFLLLFTVNEVDHLMTRPHLYLIPEGYLGRIIIVYSQPNGQPPQYQGRAQVYEIDEKGILLTQSAPDYIDGEFWYVDQSGSKVEQLMWTGSCVSDEVGDPLEICLAPGGLRNHLGQCFPIYTIFFVTYESTQDHLANGAYEWETGILESATPRDCDQ